ncbi:MAG: winged helix-turn-helix domain-containing protein [Oscillospiraceae bacterium]|nr:winged helix-turn-helix domain-containing protein [Oscillospiraceae bacterium]
MNDGKFVQRQTVWAFGFSAEEAEIIGTYIPTNAMELVAAECATDILVSDPLAVLVCTAGVPWEEQEQLLAYYQEVRDFSETVIFVGQCDPKKIGSRITVYPDFEALRGNLKYALLAAHKRKKTAESFSRSVSYALIILKEITENPGISSKELSRRLEISQRSVTRYIETLNIAGESIVYDRKKNGWSLEYSESLLKL